MGDLGGSTSAFKDNAKDRVSLIVGEVVLRKSPLNDMVIPDQCS